MYIPFKPLFSRHKGIGVQFTDEPTGALDRKNSAEIMDLLKKLSEEKLVIVITHDKKCAEYANQIVKIANGQLCCETMLESNIETAVLQKGNKSKISIWKRAFKNFEVHFSRYAAVALATSIGVLCFALSLSSGNIMERSIKTAKYQIQRSRSIGCTWVY